MAPAVELSPERLAHAPAAKRWVIRGGHRTSWSRDVPRSRSRPGRDVSGRAWRALSYAEPPARPRPWALSAACEPVETGGAEPGIPPVRSEGGLRMHPIIYQDLARARQADLRAAAVRRERKPRDRMALPRMRRRALAPALSGLKR